MDLSILEIVRGVDYRLKKYKIINKWKFINSKYIAIKEG